MKKLFSLLVGLAFLSSVASSAPLDSKAYSTANALLASFNTDDLASINLMANQLNYSSSAELLQAALDSTVSYDPDNIYDLNGDEALTVSDSLAVLQFLHGIIQYGYDYSEMDGDGDGKIDTDDSFAYLVYYTNILSGNIEDECIKTHTANSYSPETLSFKKYNAANGNYISSYTLSPSPVTFGLQGMENNISNSNESSQLNNILSSLDSGMPNYHVIYSGIQNENVYPSGIVKVQTYTGNDFTSNCIGSGFVIDDHTIATVAHAVYNRSIATSQNCKVKNKNLLIFAENGTPLTSVTVTPKEYHVPEKYTQGYTDGYDFALITVQENLEDYVSLSLGLPLIDFINSGSTVYNTGTPVEVDGSTQNTGSSHKLYTTGGSIYDFYPSDSLHKIIGAECPATASGSALYYPSNNAVLGIIRAGVLNGTTFRYSASNTIRSEMLHFFYNNPNISY